MKREQALDPRIVKVQSALFSLILTKLQGRSKAKINGCLTALCDYRAYVDKRYLASRKRKQENECTRKHKSFSQRVSDRKLDQAFLSSCYRSDGQLLGYKLIENVINRRNLPA